MIADFKFDQVMRMSSIKRWGIVEMSRQQSVAEHSFNVAIISDAICQKSSIDPTETANIISWALAHDLPEVVTGDIPSTVKHRHFKLFKDIESEMFPVWYDLELGIHSNKFHLVVKVADFIDAIQFAVRFCVDPRRENLIGALVAKCKIAIDAMEEHYDLHGKMVDESWLDLRIP